MEIGDLVNSWRVKEKCFIGRYKAVVVQCTCGHLQKIKESPLSIGKPKCCRKCGLREISEIKTGMKFGKWLVLLPRSLKCGKHRYWDVLCECGTVDKRRNDCLLNGLTKECRNCWKDKANPEAVKTRMWDSLVKNAELRGLEVAITKKDIFDLLVKQNYHCALSGEKLVISTKTSEYRKGLTTASVDRIDSDRGYYLDNIQWTHKKINCIKMDLNQEDFIRMCHQVAKHNPRDI